MLAIFPELAATAANGDIETLTCLIRKYFGASQTYSPRLDLELLLDSVGLGVTVMDIEHHGGIVAKDEKGKFMVNLIVPQGMMKGHERTFLLAHLLGHYFLHIQPFLLRGEWANTGFKEDYRPLLRFQQGSYQVHDVEGGKLEEEADLFAVALLLPKALIKRAAEKLQETSKISNFFDLPPLLVERRLEQVHLMTTDEPQNFMAAEAISEPEKTEMPNATKTESKQMPTQDKITQAKFVTGSHGYRQTIAKGESDKPETQPTPPAVTSQQVGTKEKVRQAPPKNPLEQSLKMFRKLANRLDDSVDT